MEPTLYFLDIGTESDVFPDAEGNGPGNVLYAHPPGSAAKTLITNQPYPDGIDISPSEKRIFWTNMGFPSANDGSVKSANLDGSDARVIIPPGQAHTPKQLCIDHAHAQLYFCDREGLRVHRCGFDGSGHEVIYQAGDWHDPTHVKDQTRHCVGIAVDTDHGYFYWTQKGPSKGGVGRIFRAGLVTPPGAQPDARPDVELLFDNLPEPIDLEIEHETEVLYWSDRGNYPSGNTLNRAYVGKPEAMSAQVRDENITAWPKYDVITKHCKFVKTRFSPRVQILSKSATDLYVCLVHEAIGLKLDKVSRCIWMTDIGGAVYKVDVDGRNKTKIYDTEKAFTGIAVYYEGQSAI